MNLKSFYIDKEEGITSITKTILSECKAHVVPRERILVYLQSHVPVVLEIVMDCLEPERIVSILHPAAIIDHPKLKKSVVILIYRTSAGQGVQTNAYQWNYIVLDTMRVKPHANRNWRIFIFWLSLSLDIRLAIL